MYTEPTRKAILNDLGRKEWEAVAYVEQSNTILLKDRQSIENRSGRAADHVAYDIARDTSRCRSREWDESVEAKL